MYGHESSRCRRDKKQLAASNSAKPEERQDLTEVSALCHGKSDADVPEEVRMNMDFSVMEDKKECILLHSRSYYDRSITQKAKHSDNYNRELGGLSSSAAHRPRKHWMGGQSASGPSGEAFDSGKGSFLL